ncbi:hypothetical protein ACXIVK_25390 [Paraburkholderia caledonica]
MKNRIFEVHAVHGDHTDGTWSSCYLISRTDAPKEGWVKFGLVPGRLPTRDEAHENAMAYVQKLVSALPDDARATTLPDAVFDLSPEVFVYREYLVDCTPGEAGVDVFSAQWEMQSRLSDSLRSRRGQISMHSSRVEALIVGREDALRWIEEK